jgi:hypothetical protein
MVEGSWDNEKRDEARGRMPLWAKILLGCGGFVLLLLIVIMGSCFGLARYAAKNPDKFEKKISGVIQNFTQADWTRFRDAVGALGTDEGARKLYADNPGLRANYPTESDFLANATRWRQDLRPVPQEVSVSVPGRVVYNHYLDGKSIGYCDEKGHLMQVDFDKQGISNFSIHAVESGGRE